MGRGGHEIAGRKTSLPVDREEATGSIGPHPKQWLTAIHLEKYQPRGREAPEGGN